MSENPKTTTINAVGVAHPQPGEVSPPRLVGVVACATITLKNADGSVRNHTWSKQAQRFWATEEKAKWLTESISQCFIGIDPSDLLVSKMISPQGLKKTQLLLIR